MTKNTSLSLIHPRQIKNRDIFCGVQTTIEEGWNNKQYSMPTLTKYFIENVGLKQCYTLLNSNRGSQRVRGAIHTRAGDGVFIRHIKVYPL